MNEVYIVAIARTPVGSFNGSLASLSAVQLGATVIKAAIQRAKIKPEDVQEVIMGNVLQANVGQAPARQAALAAGLPMHVQCTTINKVCASGMKAIMLAAQSILLGDVQIAVAGGMESMSNAPYYLAQGRNGYRYGNGQLIDGIVRDGLQDPYKQYMMGNVAEICAKKYNYTREMQDAYAVTSYKRALESIKNDWYKDEICAVEIPQRKGDPILITEDDEPKKFDEKKVSTINPAFEKTGTVTAINASKINDGAAAVVLMSKEAVEKFGLRPIAKIAAYADAEQDPEWFTTTPSMAIPRAIKKANLTMENIDAFEINEAFAVVNLANMQEMHIDAERQNKLGGAIALGHPIGASGARIICTLISSLKHKGGKYGAAGICNGGGGASAMVIELL